MRKIILTLLGLNIFILLNGQMIIINEFQPSNSSTIADSEGDFNDWIEIVNLTDTTINLSGWFLSDDPGDPFKWVFPEVYIPSEEYLLVFASDKDTLYPNGEVHTNFKIGNGNEAVMIYQPDSVLSDMTPVLNVNTDWSSGRYPDAASAWFFFSEPTPGTGNSTQPYGSFADPPTFSHTPGYYSNSFMLSMNAVNSEDTIYYTLDGSIPTMHSAIYTEPILLQNRANVPNRLSTIQTTLPGQGFYNWKLPNGNVYKFNTVRARVIKTGAYPSKTVSASYIIDPELHNRYNYPVVSIMTDSANLFCDTMGIYVAGVGIDSTDWLTAHFSQEGREWERDIHLEIFDENGALAVSQDAGVRIGGHYTRTTNIKSLRLYARSEYGESSFNYRFFRDQNIDSFKRIKLRNTGNDAQNAYMRDVLVNEAIKNNFRDISRWRPSIVFIDGEYWGIHNIRDRHDKYYFSDHYGIDYDKLDFLELNAAIMEGSNDHYEALIDFVSNNNMSDSANYAYVCTQLDPENYIEYLVTAIYTGQTDWPVHNVRYWRKRTETYQPDAPYGNDGRWRWLLVDQDFGLGRTSSMAENYDHLGRVLFNLSGWQNRLIVRLLGNQTNPGNARFRNQFINTFADRMNTTFLPERMSSIYQMIFDTLNPEMQEHINRWRYPASMYHWSQSYCPKVVSFIMDRPEYMRQFIVNDFSLAGIRSVTLDVNDQTMGKIQINSLRINSSTLGLTDTLQPYPWTGVYFDGIPVQITAIPEPGYEFVEWEGINEAESFITILSDDVEFKAIFRKSTPTVGDLVINEINFKSFPFQNAGQWIEIHNNSTNDYKTNNWKFRINATMVTDIPDNLQIFKGSYVVFCADSLKYHSVHRSVGGICLSDLEISNSGSLVLLANDSVIIDSVHYSAASPWPVKTSGFGPSLELINPSANNLEPENWRASYKTGGTPGRPNSTPADAIIVNEFMADNENTIQAPDGSYSDWIELYNTSSEPVDIAGLYFSDRKSEPGKWQIPAGNPAITTLQPYGYLLLWADEKTEQGELHLDFKLSTGGEFIGIYNGDQFSIIDTITFGPQFTDHSTGCRPDGFYNGFVFTSPTPGYSNGIIQEIQLPAGWSGISSYLTPFQNSLEMVFLRNYEDLEMLWSLDGEYRPQNFINSLTGWYNQDAFAVKTSEPITVYVSSAEYAEKQLEVHAGWTLLPCLSSAPVPLADLLDNMNTSGLFMSDIAGKKVFWPAFEIFTLTDLDPGKAYYFYSPTDLILVFPVEKQKE